MLVNLAVKMIKKDSSRILELEESFYEVIKIRKELSKLNNEYTKEIEFLKQAQSKRQISG
uniref:hypothetical protein n=2 Tax=Borreliella tanukii TaxID=56146 RepID=UPI003B20D618